MQINIKINSSPTSHTRLWLKVNGETKQDGNTKDMMFTIPVLIEVSFCKTKNSILNLCSMQGFGFFCRFFATERTEMKGKAAMFDVNVQWCRI